MGRKWPVLVLLILLLSLSSGIFAETQNVLMTVGDSKIINQPGFSRVATSNPEVVEVVVTSDLEVLLNAKQPGLSTVNIWSSEGINTYRISVSENFTNIEREIARLIDNPDVKVVVNSKYVVLNGSVATTLDADQAVLYGKMYRDNIINNLDVKTKYQILLSIIVTEIRKEAEKSYGFTWGQYSSPEQDKWVWEKNWSWNIWQDGVGMTQPPFNRIGSMLEAMQKNGDAKILAAPSILTLSGKEAFFLAGGEIPIPLADGEGGVKVEWKEYGIKLKVTPTLDKHNNIALSVSPEVSSLDWANAVLIGGDKMPAITMRKATTNVQFINGGTLVIGGLLKREDSETVFKIPILGDLPIIGSLFRSKEFQNGQTELLFFVTPRVIKDDTKVDPNNITKPESQGPYYD